MEFLVWNAILTLVCLKRLVMYMVSLPVYVKVANFTFSIGGDAVCGVSLWSDQK
jgi:hypothetical protein